MTDTETQAPEVRRAKLLSNGLQAVVTSIAAALFDAHAARQKVHFVVGDKDFSGCDLEVVGHGRDGFT